MKRGAGPGLPAARPGPPACFPTPLPAPHLGRQQARRARGLGAGAPLQGGLLSRVPQPPRRVLQHEGWRRRLGRRRRPCHLLQDPPQLLRAQRGHTGGAAALAGESPAAAAAAILAAVLSLWLRVRHGGRGGDSNRDRPTTATQMCVTWERGGYECPAGQYTSEGDRTSQGRSVGGVGAGPAPPPLQLGQTQPAERGLS